MTLTHSDGATQILEFQPTTPAGTPEATPYTTGFIVPSYEVESIQWVVPPGPQGNLGWAITFSGEVIFPSNGGWIITDNEKNAWPVEGQPISGAWGFMGYNTGTHPHTVYLRFVLLPGAKPTLEVPATTAELIVPTWPTASLL